MSVRDVRAVSEIPEIREEPVAARLRPVSCFSGLADRVSNWEHQGGIPKIICYIARITLFIVGYIIPPILYCYNRIDREVAVADFERTLRDTHYIYHPQTIGRMRAGIAQLRERDAANLERIAGLEGNVQRLESRVKELSETAPATPVKPRMDRGAETPTPVLRERARRSSGLAHTALLLSNDLCPILAKVLSGNKQHDRINLVGALRLIEPEKLAFLKDALAEVEKPLQDHKEREPAPGVGS